MSRLAAGSVALCLVLYATGSAQADPPPADDGARRLYDRVRLEFIHKDFSAALAGFQFFLELHGDSALAASARYWMGECELRLGRDREALRSFTAMLSRYPGNPEQAAATLRAGLAYAKLGQFGQSRLMLERVLVHFPNTTEAEQARKALRSLS